MKLQLKFTIFLVLAAAVTVVIFSMRSPVIIVTDLSFKSLYGEERIRSESRFASISLFRKVETAGIADDAPEDVVMIAISDISVRPFCVIFPLRFIHSARLYREQNPSVRVILLSGRQNEEQFLPVLGSKAGDFFIFQTDIDSDFYRAGIAAAALDMNKNGKIAVFMETNLLTQAKEAFLRGVSTHENRPETLFFNTISQFQENSGISCSVLAGTGAEYFDMEISVPVIFFTWVDPSFLRDDVVLLVNDSPWVQCTQAVRMAVKQVENGRIKSKFQLVNKKNINRETLRKMPK